MEKVFVCEYCGKPVKFKYKMYNKFCSIKCANTLKNKQPEFIDKVNISKSLRTEEQKQKSLEKSKETCKKIYGCEFPNQSPIVKEHRMETFKKKYGVPYFVQSKEFQEMVPEIQEKIKKACEEEFGVDNFSKSQEFRDRLPERTEKTKETCKRLYGVEYVMQIPDVRAKVLESKKRNGTTNTSKNEAKIKELLLIKFPDTIYQYNSDIYPFDCDFYIPSQDLYIEYHGHWTHGKEPFDKNNQKHLNIINKWEVKSKNSKFYRTAIYVWTDLDVRKLETFKKNKLNYKIFYTMKEFNKWYSTI